MKWEVIMTNTPAFDLDAYLRRIGLSGPVAPTLDTLKAIQERHPASIAFENLDSLTGRVPSLDIGDVQHKLVAGQRGGYCFEQNLLLRHALAAIGFRVSGLGARVIWNTPEDPIPPRSHMLLRVDLDDGTYTADVGFGGMTPTAPMRLDMDSNQETPHGTYRLRPSHDVYRLEALVGDVWTPLYIFDLTEHFASDYGVANWHVATHPDSLFATTLVCARTDKGKRYALRDNELSIHHAAGPSKHHHLTSPDALRDVLENTFNLNLADLGGLDARIADIFADAGTALPVPHR